MKPFTLKRDGSTVYAVNDRNTNMISARVEEGFDDDGNRVPAHVAERVAVLFAAAPELLAACQAAMGVLPHLDVHNWPPGFRLKRDAVALLQAAIAKAKGTP